MAEIIVTVQGTNIVLKSVGDASVASSGGGVTDHGNLTGLADDDHTQYAKKASNLSDLASASTARTNLGLTSVATSSVGTTAGTVAAGDDSRITGAAQKASNLSDLASASTARTNLGLGTIATQSANAVSISGGSVSGITDLAVADGGTGASTAAAARTNLGINDLATFNRTAAQVHGLNVLGHSWTAGATVSGTGTPYMEQVGMISRLCSMLGVHEDNLLHLGQSGSRLTADISPFSSIPFGGWGGALQYLLPNNSSVLLDSSNPTIAVGSAPVPGATVIVHGINDIAGDATAQQTQGRTAWQNALRAVISRARSCAVWSSNMPSTGTLAWDSAITFGGTWVNQNAVTQNTGPGYASTVVNASTVTFTIPQNFMGGTVAVCFIGQFNGRTTLSGAINNSTTTLPVTSNSQFPAASITFVANIAAEGANSAEDVLVTTTGGGTSWTVTRGVNGTTPSAHGSGAVVTVKQTAIVTWSTNGSNATITGTTAVTAQGYMGRPCALVKRFVCTAADAGKTIVATVSGLVASDTTHNKVMFDSVWIESDNPPPAVVANMPRFSYALPYASVSHSDYATWNTDTANIVAEFDSSVKVADLDSAFYPRDATLNGAITNVATSVPVTANSTSFAFTAGMVVTCDGEDMLVSAVSGSYPSYTLTVTRGYNSTSAVSHLSGRPISDGSWWHTDRIHHNALGHAVCAKVIYDALVSVAPSSTSNQLALASGCWTQDTKVATLGVVDGYFIQPSIAGFSAASFTLNKLWCHPIYVPKEVAVTGMAVVTSAAGTATSARLGIYDTDWTRARPGTLLCEFPAVATTSIATQISAANTVYKRLRPGWYFLACVNQGTTAANVRMHQTTGTGIQMCISTPNSTASALCGYSQTGVTGAMPSTWTGLTEETQVPILYLRVRTHQLL